MISERFEWLETEFSASFAPSEVPSTSSQGKRCPRCQWLDYATVSECFRCGYEFSQDSESLLKLRQLKLEPKPLAFQVDPPEKWFYQRKNISYSSYQLQREAEEAQLTPGFETLISLPQLKIKYFKHQIDNALKALRDLHGQTLLADEVGLGKTVEAGIILKELILRKLAYRVLILVPAHLITQWQQEMEEKFSETFVVPKTEEDWKQNRLILSFSRARSSAKTELLQNRFDLLIVDEAHKLKNRGTKQYQVVEAMPKKYVLFLSATPFHNRLPELYNLVHLIKPGLLGTMKAFNRQFVDNKSKYFPKNTQHLRRLLKKVLLRNRREQVGIDIPKRRVGTYHLNFFPAEEQYYQTVSKFLKEELLLLQQNYPLAQRGAQILVLMTLQRELCSSIPAAQKNLQNMKRKASPKMQQELTKMVLLGEEIKTSRKAEACLEILKKSPFKTIVFTEFKATVTYLAEFFQKHGITSVCFTGDVPPEDRLKVLAKFKEETQIMISTNSGGEGFNVQFAHQIINYDLPWNPMVLEQRIGRIHRLGQTEEAKIFNLSVYGTIEAKILELLTNKIQIFKMAIGELDLILGALQNEKTFEELLKDTWLNSLKNQEEADFEELGEELKQSSLAYQEIKKSEKVFSSLVHPPSPS